MTLPISEDELEALVADIIRRTLGQENAPPGENPAGQKVISLGADHRALDLKAALQDLLQELGYEVLDCGVQPGSQAADYPDIAEAVATAVSDGRAWRGIVIDGAGIGSCIAANKVPGIRAALCYNQATAANSREHNDANILALGSGMIGVGLAKKIVETWLSTPFGGGRHARRVQKIQAMESRYSRSGSRGQS